jgi:hypothetical protein
MSGPPADQPYTWTDPATGKTYYLQDGRFYADYLKWSEGDKSGQRTFGDTLTNNLAQQIRDSFAMQSPTQKGYALTFQPGGRLTGF